MTQEIQSNTPKKKEKLDDNARKFLLEALNSEFLDEHGASSLTLTVDWLETGNNDKKLAYKKFDNGDVQILLIAKVTIDGNRTAEKQKITEGEYKKLLPSSILHLEKKRHEFTYTQNEIEFACKYDEFANSDLCMLEVDASSVEERHSFKPEEFPIRLEEVSGDRRYSGYEIVTTINAANN